MSTLRRTRASRAGQWFFGGLAVVLLGALIWSFVESRSELRDQERAAQVRAQSDVGSVLFDALTPELVGQPILGADRRSVALATQPIFADDRVARVRIWGPDGTLVYSSDVRDRVGDVVAQNDPHLAAAEKGQTLSSIARTTVAPPGRPASEEELYQTFVPLRLFNQLGVSGVVEIDQPYSAIQNAANRIWRPAQIAMGAALLATLGLFVLARRVAPTPAEATESGFGTTLARPVPPGTSTTRASQAAAVADPGVADRLREAEHRATAAERAAREAEERARAAEQRSVELQAQHSAAAGARERLAAEAKAAGATRAALEAELQRASASADVDQSKAREAETRTAEELQAAVAELDELRRKLNETESTLGNASASAKEKETALEELRVQHERAVEELGAVRATLETTQAELGSLKQAQDAAEAAAAAAEEGAREARDAADQVADLGRRIEELEGQRAQDLTTISRTTEALNAARVQLDEANQRVVASEARASKAEAVFRDLEIRVQRANGLAAEAESRARESAARAERAETNAAEINARASQAESLTAELETRAVQAEARAEGAEAREQELLEPPPEPIVQLAQVLTGESRSDAASGLVSRLVELRREIEHEREEPAEGEETVGDESEDGPSLRERLTQAAAARHRVTGN
jgi:chromosome segregation ATPase